MRLLQAFPRFLSIPAACAAFLTLASAAWAAGPSCEVRVDGLTFDSQRALVDSEYFKAADLRCGTPERSVREAVFGTVEAKGVAADCSASSTNPDAAYAPGDVFVIPVVVHILMDDACENGALTDQQVESQIEILNEDFRALAGTNGAPGFDTGIRFELATVDPNDQPTNGITRSCNTTWYNDNGTYYNSLAWDPNRYMNIYTNQAGGNLGYVPFLPADSGGAFVGSNNDRVVVFWQSFGRDAPLTPYDQGRTATHEVGHYLGMEHTFTGGCAAGGAPGCYSNGDLICDTEPESSPHFSPCTDPATCGDPDPIHNYMDYSDDLCMWEFTEEQTRRMRCSLINYRSDLYTVDAGMIFTDGFESGNTTGWSATVD